LPRGFLTALVGVECLRQRETVVALLDGAMRLFERAGGRGEFCRGVALRARCTRGVDGALGTIEFFLWWFRARGAQDQRAEQRGEATH
jgi:hypothetical protein